MAQPPVGGPFGEADLGDEPGFHPVHPGPGQATDGFEGRIRPLKGGQGRVQADQGSAAPPQPTDLHTAGALPPFSKASSWQKLTSLTFQVPSRETAVPV